MPWDCFYLKRMMPSSSATIRILLVAGLGVGLGSALVLSGCEESADRPSAPSSGALHVSTDPAGAMIYLDGVNTFIVTPALLKGIEPGTHTLTLSKQGYQDSTVAVMVLSDSEGVIHVELRPIPPATGGIAVHSDPPGARISLDGIGSGLITPDTLYAVAVGTHLLGLSLEGYEEHKESVEVHRDSVTLVQTTLTPREPNLFGHLGISSRPAGAIVHIDGVDTGLTTPSLVRDVRAGIHQVRLQLDGYEVAHATVTVVADITTNLSMDLQPTYAWGYAYVDAWEGCGSSPGEFGRDLGPLGVAADESYVYVADYSNHRIQVFGKDRPDGAPLSFPGYPGEVQLGLDGGILAIAHGRSVVKMTLGGEVVWDTYLPNIGWVNDGLCIDSGGQIHASSGGSSADARYHSIHRYTSTGGYIGFYGSDVLTSPRSLLSVGFDIYVVDVDRVRLFTRSGSDMVYKGVVMSLPDGVEGLGHNSLVRDRSRNFLIGCSDKRIRKYDSSWRFVAEFGTVGHGPGQFTGIQGLCTDSQGHLYVCDGDNPSCSGYNRRVHRFRDIYD